jgi:hypothetical protein
VHAQLLSFGIRLAESGLYDCLGSTGCTVSSDATKENTMYETQITLPELGLVGGTRLVLGLGLGLLLASRLTEDQRKAVGWSLALVGGLTTIPLAMEVLGKRKALTESLV